MLKYTFILISDNSQCVHMSEFKILFCTSINSSVSDHCKIPCPTFIVVFNFLISHGLLQWSNNFLVLKFSLTLWMCGHSNEQLFGMQNRSTRFKFESCFLNSLSHEYLWSRYKSISSNRLRVKQEMYLEKNHCYLKKIIVNALDSCKK